MPSASAPLRGLQSIVITSASALLLIILLFRFLLASGKESKSRRKKFKSVDDVGSLVGAQQGKEDTVKFDFIVVGGGTAGCVLANRLSEDASVSVLLLEAGPSGRASFNSRVPSTFLRIVYSKLAYNLYTTEQTNAGKRKLFWPRGKMLGGCSSMNAQMFQRGAPSDFDEWAKIVEGMDGAEGWAYSELEKYFLKFENFTPNKLYPGVNPSVRGKHGPVDVGYPSWLSNFCSKWIKACEEIGIAHASDVNTAKGTLGVTKIMTYTTSKGERTSTETAYLTDDVLARPNLTVVTGAQATKILFETSEVDQKKYASGVEYTHGKGAPRRYVRANKEVIIAAGAIHSPHLLMLSGIGPRNELEKHGIPVHYDLPGAGKHLMDHPVINGFFELKEGESFMYMTRRRLQDIRRMIPKLIEYLRFGTGVVSSNNVEAAAFVRSTDRTLFPANTYGDEVDDATSGSNAPDLELYSSPYAWHKHNALHKSLPMVDVGTVGAVLLRPTSIGTLTLNSSDPFDQPIMDPNYLATDHDVVVLARGFDLAIRTTRTETMKPLLAGTLTPFDDATLLTMDNNLSLDKDILRTAVRERMETLYHPTSTCRMAPLNKDGVVDAHLKVHGVEGLRVVDASVFPNIVAGHTAAAVIAIGEKASDLIKAAHKEKA